MAISVVRSRFEIQQINPWAMSEDGDENYWADQKSNVAYVHVPAFTRNTAKSMQARLKSLRKEGMKSLVLDLRNCGGGLLSAAVDVSNMFIDEGVILQSSSRNKERAVTDHAEEGASSPTCRWLC
ncbi:MAG: hypothetical protein CMJ78_16755 [Planctomycetaceae bacterium]|nr:hypothetical protein [Planctomycetaceae bacterium]